MHAASLTIPATATVPAAFVQWLHEHLADRGLPAATALAEGLAAALPSGLAVKDKPLTPYPAQAYCAQLEHAAEVLNEPALGLALGRSFRPAMLGALGYVFASSDSLGDAMDRLGRYHVLVHPTNELRLRAHQGVLIVEWPATNGRYGRVFEEMGLAAFVHAYRSLRGSTDAIPCVDFIGPPPADPQPYADYFGGQVRFDEPATRIHLPQSYLVRPFINADPVLRALLQPQVDASLQTHMEQADAFCQRVRREIARQAYAGPVSLAGVAAGLRLTQRQLRHRLKQQQRNFRALSEDVLYTLAERHLQDPALSIQQIAELLGYSEHSAFTRAYRRWSGRSPREYRVQARIEV